MNFQIHINNHLYENILKYLILIQLKKLYYNRRITKNRIFRVLSLNFDPNSFIFFNRPWMIKLYNFK